MANEKTDRDDFRPTASLEMLRKRANVMCDIRQFFDSRGFFEVETPLLSHDIVIDRHLNPIGIPKKDVTGREADVDDRLWLQTSPEFGMKRLVAAGADAIYQTCKAFRQSESGKRHNPEFTMLEWYRTGDDLQAGMELLGEFVSKILGRPKPKLVSYQTIFQSFAGVDPFLASLKDLSSCISDARIAIELSLEETNRDEFLNLILSEMIEPKLGIETPVIIYDWPASQAALSIVRDDEISVAERFELYVDGVELANGYHELLDAEELQRRNSVNNQQRQKDGNSLLPESSRLLHAMENGMPGCAGVALGVDRLVMLMTGAETISEVVAFPVDRA